MTNDEIMTRLEGMTKSERAKMNVSLFWSFEHSDFLRHRHSIVICER